MDEVGRIRIAYSNRRGDGNMYSFFNQGTLFTEQQIEKALLRLLRRHQVSPLGSKKILEVGCGTGVRLRELIRYGANPENLFGVDLLPTAIEQAKKICPSVNFRCGNADSLPFESESLDVVTQFTMFTSILAEKMKRRVASEMLRVLKPSGIILWYDYFVSKPTNLDVKGIGKREIIKLFPNCTCDFSKVTLAPPIARAVAPYSFLVCYLLEKIPVLKTHYLVVIRKRS